MQVDAGLEEERARPVDAGPQRERAAALRGQRVDLRLERPDGGEVGFGRRLGGEGGERGKCANGQSGKKFRFHVAQSITFSPAAPYPFG